jgi:peptidylprolyl isomerase
MRLRPTLLACALVCAWLPLSAQQAPKYKSAQEILDASPASDWRTLDPANTLYLELGNPEQRRPGQKTGRVIIELAPAFAPEHVANIRTLAREGFWNGLSIYRSQDNFVVQFGDPDAEDASKAKSQGSAKKSLPAEFARKAKGLDFTRLPDSDGWAPEVGFVDGFPAARDPKTGEAWLAHCYGALGAGRGAEPDSSNGSELYVVTGQSPRQLDRNITLVGRVVQGMELLSVIARGPAPMGFYEKPEQRTPIKAIRLASEVPESERTPLQLLRTDSKTFTEATEARRNRRDGWYVRPAGHIDLCNVPLPVRTPE